MVLVAVGGCPNLADAIKQLVGMREIWHLWSQPEQLAADKSLGQAFVWARKAVEVPAVSQDVSLAAKATTGTGQGAESGSAGSQDVGPGKGEGAKSGSAASQDTGKGEAKVPNTSPRRPLQRLRLSARKPSRRRWHSQWSQSRQHRLFCSKQQTAQAKRCRSWKDCTT